MRRCGFFARWWHQRQRSADREIMMPIMERAAHGNMDHYAWGWRQFTAAEGQEHWRCECAERDQCEAA